MRVRHKLRAAVDILTAENAALTVLQRKTEAVYWEDCVDISNAVRWDVMTVTQTSD
jgi:hypothetical protein